MQFLANPPLATELFAIMAIMLYGVVLSYALPQKRHFMVNVLCAGIVVIFGLIAGLSLGDMGLAPYQALRGLAIAAVISAVLAGVIYGSAHIPALSRFFGGEPVANGTRRQIAYAIGVRIPLSTALLEETLFRGVLLGLLLTTHGTMSALIIASVLFGIWHVFPTVAQMESNPELAKTLHKKTHRIGTVFGVIMTTSLAGFLFGVMRLWSGSLLTPWLIHWTINATGVLAARRAASRQS